MGQFTWKYVDVQPPQTVTLYHGDKTGHVLITLNSKVLIIDFKVRDTKSYSFFIEEELCEINITRTNDSFSYTFEVDKDVQTPLNVKRKKKEKKHLWQTAGFFGLMIFIFVMIGIGLQWSKKSKAGNIRYEGNAKAIISLSEEASNYTYEIDGLFYENELLEIPETINHFPLETNDEFTLKYNELKPEQHQFSLDNPTEEQLERYTKRAIEKQAKLHLNDTEAHAECLVRIGFDMRGISALADFYFQDKTESENKDHNENTYKRLIRSVEFQQKSQKCLSY